MISRILYVLWFFLPAALANIAPVIAAKLPIIRNYPYPLDFYRKFRGKRILGDHKTVRGLIAGIVTGICVVWLQKALFANSESIRQAISLDYDRVPSLELGFLLGFGPLLGDAVKSFFKRQLALPPGTNWFPFDQIDYILGSILVSMWYIRLSFTDYILIFAIGIVGHILINMLGYFLGLKEVPY